MTFRRIIGLTLIVALDLIFAPSAIAELAPQWYGVWKSASGQESLTISASKIITEFQREDEPGKFRNIKIELKWSDSNDPNPSKDEERFGYSKKRISPSDVAHIFENAVNTLGVGQPDFSVSDPKISRQAIKSISPGVYKIVWTYFGGDCGNNEYILDGDKILEMDQCKYRVGVRLFKRENAFPNGVPATHTSDSQRDSSPVPTGTLNGIWEGKVQQGNMTYPVMISVRASRLNAPSGTIDFPGLGCGGSIVLTKVIDKVFMYREIIERGQDKCANGGLLSLTVNPEGGVDRKYLAPNNPANVLATAKLSRRL